MTGTITTGNVPRALQEGVRTFFGEAYKERDPIWNKIFDSKQSQKAFEVDVQLEGFGLASKKPEGQEVQFDSRRQGFAPKYINATYAKGFVITEEMMEDNLYNLALSDARSLGKSMRVTKEIVHHNIINNGFNAAFVMPDGDGKSLFATDHLNGPSNTGTYSNRLAVGSAFSEAALEDLLIQVDKATDARDKPIHLMAERLVGPPELRFDFERVLESVLQSGSDTNNVNAVNNMGAIRDGYMTSVYLTSPTAWFLKTDCDNGLNSFERRALQFGEDNSFTTGNARFKASERYQPGWTDPRGIYAGNE
jgi:hypothetical protein